MFPIFIGVWPSGRRHLVWDQESSQVRILSPLQVDVNVMGEYQKITKEFIDLPRYCYFFIKEIQESVDEYNIKEAGDEIEIVIETSNHPYCYDALELIRKAFIRKNFFVKMPSYKMTKEDGVRTYTYRWNLKKIDDLPF